MRADAISLLKIFAEKQQLEVPLFQRQYVWNETEQWSPLWEDIARKFSEFLHGRKTGPVHFLGAMVLDQQQTQTGHVPKRQVIDGQQRLTTFQIFLAAFRDLCDEHGCAELAGECKSYLINSGMLSDAAVDAFKVWPTQLDRQQFADVMTAGSRTALDAKHPLIKKPKSRYFLKRPRMVEAYAYFRDELDRYFFGDSDGTPALFAEVELRLRLEECYQALKNALQVVVIDLGVGDDAQVIFETLNARGEPLLPADLVRNFIFLRAARLGESQQRLYERYWARFDEGFWREQITQGRSKRPRSDLFMQHYLTSAKGHEVPVKHMFVEYKHWIEHDRPFASVEAELSALSKLGEAYRAFSQPDAQVPLAGLARFLTTFETGTCYPLLLGFVASECSDEQLSAVARTLESYVLRRAVCGLETKNYNNIFLGVLRACRRDGFDHAVLVRHLQSLSGLSGAWPSDAEFRQAWMTLPAYFVLNSSKIAYLLERLNRALHGSKTEHIRVTGNLSVEHLMPQSWVTHWPFPDGSKGVTRAVLLESDGLHHERSRARYEALQTIGNLTLLTAPLNSAVSNGPWLTKQGEILRFSSLPINQDLREYDRWDVDTIETRGAALFEHAVKIWAKP